MLNIVFFVFLIQAICYNFSVDEKCNVNIKESEYNQLLTYLNTEDPIGNGGNGEIYKFPVEEQPHCKIAVKVIYETTNVTFSKEVKILRKLQYSSFPYSPKFYGFYKSTSSHSTCGFVFMELIDGMDLFDLLNKKKHELPDMVYLVAQIAYVIEGLHKNNIVHRDIKLENFIYNPTTRKVTIVDFGFAVDPPSLDVKFNVICGTEFYMSPEMRDKKKYSYDVDWYAYGCLVHQLFFQIPTDIPFYDIRETLEGNQDVGMDLILHCTELKSEDRIKNLEMLKGYPIFKNIHWEDFGLPNNSQNALRKCP